MARETVKIVAKTESEFNKIKEELEKLPAEVYHQIDTAEDVFGIRCVLKEDKKDIILPTDIIQISCDVRDNWCYFVAASKTFSFHRTIIGSYTIAFK